MASLLYGSRIQVISKNEIKYEGTLTLSQVVCKGTEGRRPIGEVSASTVVYDRLMFKGSDVKDLKVLTSPTAPSTESPPPINKSVFDSPLNHNTINKNNLAVVTVAPLPLGFTDSQVMALFHDPSAILSVKLLTLPGQEKHVSADVLFSALAAAKQAVALFDHPDFTAKMLRTTHLSGQKQQQQRDEQTFGPMAASYRPVQRGGRRGRPNNSKPI